jgi:hypothetical protein
MSVSTRWPVETSHWQPKFAKPEAHFARIASFRPFAVVHYCRHSTAFSIAEVMANICMLLSRDEL